MFYLTPKGRTISIFNKRPRNYSAGGPIVPDKRNPIKDEDSISSQLEIGSLVIPCPVVKTGIMDLYDGPITGPKTKDPRRLTPTIVMENEIVVHKDHAPRVTQFLKKHGITLPLPG